MWSMPGLRQRVDQLDLARGRDRAFLDLKAFARPFFGDVHGRRQIAHEASPAVTMPRLINAVDLGRRKRRARQGFRAVCSPMRGRLPPQAEIVIVHLDRQARQFRALAVRERDLQHAAAGVELRIVEQVARLGHRRKRNIDAVEQFGKLGELMPRDDFGDERAQHGPRAHAVLVGLVGRIGQQILPREMLAEAPPLAVAGDADENLFAVGGREGFVDRPGAVARRHRRHRLAGHHFAGHVRHHQKRGGFEQSGFDRLAAAGALALAQRRLDADHREHAAHDVDDRSAGAQRLARRSGHVGKPGHELHHFVERRAMLVGSAEEPFERAVDRAADFFAKDRHSRSRAGPWCPARNFPERRRRFAPRR